MILSTCYTHKSCFPACKRLVLNPILLNTGCRKPTQKIRLDKGLISLLKLQPGGTGEWLHSRPVHLHNSLRNSAENARWGFYSQAVSMVMKTVLSSWQGCWDFADLPESPRVSRCGWLLPTQPDREVNSYRTEVIVSIVMILTPPFLSQNHHTGLEESPEAPF